MTVYNLFPLATTTVPLNPAEDDLAVTVGTEFWADASGYTITKLRWWVPNNSTALDLSSRQGAIYEITDENASPAVYTMVGSVENFPTGTAGQWCEVTLSSPIAMTPYMRYIVAVYHPFGQYPASGGYFVSGGEGATSLVQDGLHRPNRAGSFLGELQGRYEYGSGMQVPKSSFNGASYFSDVEVTDETSGVTLSPSGIASAEAFGTAVATATLTAEPGGIASGEALGTPVASTTLTATATAIDTLESFGTPAATATLTATADGIASEEALGSPAASATLTASPSGIATDETFGTATASATLTAAPDGITSAEAFGTPAAAAGTLTASPDGIASTEAFGTPTASTMFTASPAGIASAETFGDPAMSGTLTATAEGIESAAAFGTPSATGPATTATATGIGTLEVFGTPTANKRITLRPTAIASALAMGTPSAIHTPASVTATAVAISSLEVFGTPAASGSLGVPQGRDYAGSIPPSRYSGTYSNHRWDGSLG
ncbi:MAG TPA: DUF4082 domain-containing protein [Arthrobacter sp.]|nr:DUF4082 domain-containing protein [Arthrobacter sp.]